MSISINAVTIKLFPRLALLWSDLVSLYPGPGWRGALTGCRQECWDDLYWRVIIGESWGQYRRQSRPYTIHHSMSNDETWGIISYIFTSFTSLSEQRLGSTSIGSVLQPGNRVSIQPRSVWFCWKGNPNDISDIIEERRARWLTVTIKLLIKENISCWLQADQKSFMELTRPLYHSCQREWLENFSWISLSEIYYRLCLR